MATVEQSLGLHPDKIPLDEMWKFIDDIIKPHPLVLDRSVLTYE